MRFVLFINTIKRTFFGISKALDPHASLGMTASGRIPSTTKNFNADSRLDSCRIAPTAVIPSEAWGSRIKQKMLRERYYQAINL